MTRQRDALGAAAWNNQAPKWLSPTRATLSQRNQMTTIRDSQSVEFNSRGLVLLTSLLLVFLGAAAAKDHKSMKPTSRPQVIAHIQFDGMSEVDMTIQNRPGDKYYLYVQHSKGEGVSIMDVSRPEKPQAIAILHEEDAAGGASMTISGNLAIVSEHAAASSHGAELSDTNVVLWDTSDPKSPRLVQKFSKVMKWLQDDREFIYVLADDGLWIVSQPHDQPLNSLESSTLGG
jgi:hypothetical protein